MPLLALITACSAWLQTPARAEVPENQYVYIQALGGGLAPLDERQSASLGVGAAAGFRTSPYFTLGGYFLYSTQSLTVVTNETSVENFTFGPEFVYHAKDLEGLEGLTIGVMTGVSYRFFSSLSSSTGTLVREESGALDVVLGPRLGYEYTLDLGLAFGAQSFLLYDFADGRAGPFGVLASVRVWF